MNCAAKLSDPRPVSAECADCDILVIGGGPAGLSAAREAAEAGAQVICLDLYAKAGGQYTMQPGASVAGLAQSEAARFGAELIRAAEAAGVRLITGAEVFWIETKGRGFSAMAALRGGEAALNLTARRVIVAAGAMERPMPFPGWTLPGVIGAGAAQRLIKSSGRLPFRGKVVLAGTGPFLTAVASTFASGGQKIAHFVEMQPQRRGAALAMLASWPSRWRAALGLLSDLRRSGAQCHYGEVVVAALGTERLEAVELAPLGADGRPDLSRKRRIEGVGALCIGYGFQPVTDITTALGAAHGYDAALGGWHCLAAADSGLTSCEGLYVAGETCGIGGMRPAISSGRIAGIAAAQSLDLSPRAPEIRAKLARTLAKDRRFAAALAAHWPQPAEPPAGLDADTVICRCEDVRLSDIRAAIKAGAAESFAVKLWTRAGMGPCQGRVCGAALASLLAGAGISAQEAGANRPHFPLRPVPLSAIRACLAARPEAAPAPEADADHSCAPGPAGGAA